MKHSPVSGAGEVFTWRFPSQTGGFIIGNGIILSPVVSFIKAFRPMKNPAIRKKMAQIN